MPPIPVSTDVSERIARLEKLETDLREFQIPRLRAIKTSVAEQQQCASELREDIQGIEKELQAFVVLAERHPREATRQEILGRVDQFQRSLLRLRKEFQAALIASKKAIDATGLSRREELLRSSSLSEKDELKGSSEDILMQANRDLTNSLQRTVGIMQKELEKSVLSTQMLESSTASLRSTTSQHEVMDTLLDTGRSLMKLMEKADWMDRLLIFAALGFFFLVVLFVLKQRILDRGLRIAFFWTKFLPDFSGDAAFLRDLEAQEATSALSSAAASVATGTESSLVSTTMSSIATVITAIIPAASVAGLTPNAALEKPAESVGVEPESGFLEELFGALNTSVIDTDKASTTIQVDGSGIAEEDKREETSKGNEKHRKDEL